jgi:Ca2+-binding EF-hand superfamily protein
MFKRTLIAALFLVPALGFAAGNTTTTTATAPKGERGSYFTKADADGNGTLSRAEVEKSMPRLAEKFDQIDTNKDGQLSRDEMKAWKKTHKQAHKKGNKADRQARAAERFMHADTNGDGKISRAEAEQNAPRLAKKFDAIDADKDGQLTQDELRAYRESKRNRKDKG